MPLEIDMIRHLPQTSKKGFELTSFSLLPYITQYWLWHTVHSVVEDTSEARKAKRRANLFQSLVLWKQLLFDFTPWEDLNGSNPDSTLAAILGWALMANHQYLIWISLKHENFRPENFVIRAWTWFIEGRSLNPKVVGLILLFSSPYFAKVELS